MVFTGFGVLIGPIGLDVLDLGHDAAPVLTLIEAALALLFFTDSMTVRRRDLRTGGFLPLRLLAIGLPLSIGLGWLLAWPLLPGLTLWEFALLGALLAPTDAALGKTARSSPRVPPLVRNGRVVAATIGLSILLHGMSAPYFADLYGNWYDAAKTTTPDLREAQDTSEGFGKQHGGSRRLR
ncbi:hypothetical protein QA942_14175 [Streptomyces sp. B21-106]|uniref:hypothetical protein n=1 Tax=unclassified Streptomyces TaxID=2593676 RepID=UPI002FF22149